MQTILAKKCILIAFFRQKVDFLEQKGAFEGQKSKVKGQRSREIDDWTIYDLTNDLQF